MDSKKLLLPLLLLSAAMAWAGGIEAPPSAESVTGLKAWIEENVSAADVSAEIEGAVAAHAVATTTHGVSGVADVASVTEHVNATGTAVHGLGTMATEAKTDYVATGTFTAHTDDASDPHGATLTQTTIVSDSVDGVDVSAHVTDNSDVHGCTAIASASAVADALSAANASDALNLRIDGSRTMTGSLKFDGAYGIYANTIDGADNTYITVAGGGTGSVERGAVIHAAGNELSTVGGTIRYYGGNVTGGDHIFYTGSGIERFRIGYDGYITIKGNIKASGNAGITQSTNDGTDNGYVFMAGGGALASARGAAIQTYGNEHVSTPGRIYLDAGNVSEGHILFRTGADSERMRITSGGRVGIGVTDPYSALEVSPAISLRNTDNGTMRALHGSRFGYSGSYKAIVLGGSAYNETICVGYDPINNATSQFSGNGSEFILRNGMMIKSPNSADNAFHTYMRLVDGNVLINTTTDDGTNKLQVNGSVAISSFMQLASPTAIPTAAAGRVYFNGTEAKFKKCLNGSTWVDM